MKDNSSILVVAGQSKKFGVEMSFRECLNIGG